MPENLIRQKRLELGLTQRSLAKRVGTSQQQIQRIESGIQTTRLELAVAVAMALDSPLPQLFPELSKIANESKLDKRKKQQPRWEEKDFIKAGIDPDPRHWTLKFGLHDGATILYRISSQEKERVSNIIWSADFEFIVFDTLDKCVAIRRAGINFCQFLVDFGVLDREEDDESNSNLKVWFLAGGAISFGIEPDNAKLIEDESGSQSQMQKVFLDLESSFLEDDEIVWFDDEDGERVYIRVRNLLRLEVPLRYCEPELFENSLQEFDEQGEGRKDTLSGDRELSNADK